MAFRDQAKAVHQGSHALMVSANSNSSFVQYGREALRRHHTLRDALNVELQQRVQAAKAVNQFKFRAFGFDANYASVLRNALGIASATVT